MEILEPKSSYNVVALPGDGVGPEITAQGLAVLRLVGKKLGIDFKINEIECGGHYYLEHGQEWEDGSFEACEQSDLIILGAVGHKFQGKTVMTDPGEPYEDSQLAGYAQVIGNRQKLELYANVRPVKKLEGVVHRTNSRGRFRDIWDPQDVDYVIIRENLEDAYTFECYEEGDGSLVTPIRISPKGSERVIRYGFELARKRKELRTAQGKVSGAILSAKWNAIGAHRLMLEKFREIGKEYPDIEQGEMLADAFNFSQFSTPDLFDVVIMANFPGDMASDAASYLQGGMGMAAGANTGLNHCMVEFIAGSAPKYTGQYKVNPAAGILAVKMGLEYLGERFSDMRLVNAANKVEAAVQDVILRKILTYDQNGDAKTDEVGRRVVESLDSLLEAA